MTEDEMDPDRARDLLARATASRGATGAVADSDRRRYARFTAWVGVLMAAYLFTTMVFLSRIQVLWLVSLMVYVVGILWLALRHNRQRLATPPKWGRRYKSALYVSLVFYIAGIAINTVVTAGDHHWSYAQSLAVAIPLTIATAAPMLYAAHRTVHE